MSLKLHICEEGETPRETAGEKRQLRSKAIIHERGQFIISYCVFVHPWGVDRVAFMEDCRSFHKDSQFRDRSITAEISVAKSTLLEQESILAADLDVGRRTLESASTERDEVMKRLGDKLEGEC